MITHEEARKKLSVSGVEARDYIKDYIAQQEKVNRLLELYRKAHIDVLNGELADQIEVLEAELK